MAAQTTNLRKFTGGGVALAVMLTLAGVFFMMRPGSAPRFSITNGGSKASAAQTVTITMKGQHFEADRDTVKAGEPVSIVLVNNDTMNHEFSIAALNISSGTIRPGQSITVTFTPDKAGDYKYICPMPGHIAMGMVGTLHVTE